MTNSSTRSAEQILKRAQEAQQAGEPALALQLYQQVLAVYPNETSLQAACGNICIALARFEEAAGYFRRVLSATKSAEALKALCYALQAFGNACHGNGQYATAMHCFEDAVQLQPHNAAFWYNLGNAQRESGHAKSASESFLQAIKYAPGDADSYNNLGNVQRELGLLDEAIANYEKALELKPDLHHALVHLVHQKQHICDWQHLNEQIATIQEWALHKPSAQISPFAFLALPGTTALSQKICASNYLAQNYQALFRLKKALNFTFNRAVPHKIRLAYLSADFRLHPLAFLITELIEHHDRNQFEVFAYAYGKQDETTVAQRLRQAFDHYVDINQLSNLEAANRIHADQIDILIDLTGFTHNSRTEIVALKPAPVSVNWLGFPGTMGDFSGVPLFDYLLADSTIAPNQADYCEKLVYLPCYQPNGQRLVGKTTLKTMHQLPESAFVFCCFNQTFKITAAMFSIWMRLLQQIPNSVLWLLDCNAWAKANLRKEANTAGIAADRLVFAPRVTSEAHLERHRHAGLFLDTLPYNAHTTASDALWMDVPVLTCLGETLASRVAASLLRSMQLDELVCESFSEYEAKALDLASHPQKLLAIKQVLIANKAGSNLFNARQFALDLEAKYRLMLVNNH